jgi:hypothetical protein
MFVGLFIRIHHTTLEQVKAACPTKEFDQRFALENVGRNEIASTETWYGIMYNEAKNGQ